MTQYPDLFAALAAPFDVAEIKHRSQNGRQLAYVTARTIMNRLDAVVGPENWWNAFVPGERSVLCQLTIRLPDGTTLTKQDAGGYAGMADSGDDDKSGYSDALKRAAVMFGVSRYLYNDGVPAYVTERNPAAADPRPEPARAQGAAPAGGYDPRWGNGNSPSPVEGRTHGHGHGNGNGHGTGAPRTGKALFAWTKEQEQRYSVGLLKYLNSWAKLQDYPGRIVDWDPEQVALAHAEAVRKLQTIEASTSDAYEEALSQ